MEDGIIKTNHLFTEPLTLYGEGSYALSAVKEIDGTKAFLRLDEGVKNCQSRETFQDCQAREYVRKGLARCGCVPFQIRNYARHVSCHTDSHENIFTFQSVQDKS